MSKRVKKFDERIMFGLSKTLNDQLIEMSDNLNLTKSEILRMMISNAYKLHKKSNKKSKKS